MKTENKSTLVEYTPIGVFHTHQTPETGAPRQGILQADNAGEIEIFALYQNALTSLELFEYIIVIYHLDRIKGWHPEVCPPASNPKLKFGLFATRTPHRPNPIGFAVVKLNKIQHGTLYVSGIDAFDGTPVLDVKPYVPRVDCVESKLNSDIEKDLGLRDKDFKKNIPFVEN